MITIGIDIGTTNSAVAYHDGNSAEIIPAADGSRTIPSAVAVLPDGQVLVGEAALHLRGREDVTRWVFTEIKRYIGKDYSEDQTPSWQHAKGEDGLVWWRGPDRLYSTPELYSLIVRSMLDAAEMKILVRPKGVVVTVPAQFTEKQVSETILGVEKAGVDRKNINVRREPTMAAVMAGTTTEKHRFMAVVDLGGGTLDVSIVESGRGDTSVITTKGDPTLGGVCFDERIVDQLCASWMRRNGDDLKTKPYCMDRIEPEAEAAKKRLSTADKTDIKIDHFQINEDGGAGSFDASISQAELEKITEDLIRRAVDLCAECEAEFREVKGDKLRVTEVILIGGQTRMPAVQRAVADYFGKSPNMRVNPEEAVAQGAATIAAEIDKRIALHRTVDRTSAAYGLRNASGLTAVVIKRNTPYPVGQQVLLTTNRDGQEAWTLQVLQGDSFTADMNETVATHHVEVPAGGAGEATVNAIFRVNENGLLEVLAGLEGQEATHVHGESQ